MDAILELSPSHANKAMAQYPSKSLLGVRPATTVQSRHLFGLFHANDQEQALLIGCAHMQMKGQKGHLLIGPANSNGFKWSIKNSQVSD